MGMFSTWHIAIVCIVIFLLFGKNLFSNTMKDLGEAMRQLRKLNEEEAQAQAPQAKITKEEKENG
jgi:TatA/E family protein of Tat protein translocase